MKADFFKWRAFILEELASSTLPSRAETFTPPRFNYELYLLILQKRLHTTELHPYAPSAPHPFVTPIFNGLQ